MEVRASGRCIANGMALLIGLSARYYIYPIKHPNIFRCTLLHLPNLRCDLGFIVERSWLLRLWRNLSSSLELAHVLVFS